jgi:hypothetical protein
MIPTARLLTNIETCPRKGFWSKRWAKNAVTPTQMVKEAMTIALTATEAQGVAFGEIAGSHVMQLAQDNSVDTDTTHGMYPMIVHHACLADILVSAARKPEDPAWNIPESTEFWIPDCMMSADGRYLRRIVLASNWSQSRHYGECRSWYTLGEIATYELPMQIAVFIIGQEIDGFRRSPWVSGFLHPSGNKVLRFRKKGRSGSEVFSEKWEKIRREDHAEITREKWLDAMLENDILREICFSVEVPVPPRLHLARIREMAEAKIGRMRSLRTPEKNLSTCEWPVRCEFLKCCHGTEEHEPHEKYGFHRI